MIKQLNSETIDRQKWDECIHRSSNGLIYSLSFYLDQICDNWDALVQNDYEAVMPLPWNSRMGVHSIYPPFFAQQLGVSSTVALSANQIDAFAQAIPKRYKRIQLYINGHNDFPLKSYRKTTRNNLVLNLDRAYETIRQNYSSNTKRNLNKALKSSMTILEDQNPEQLIETAKLEIPHTLVNYTEKDFQNLIRLMYKCIHNGMGQIMTVLDEGNRIGAQGFFLNYKGRITNLFPVASSVGRQSGAMFLLLDAVIKANCGTNFLLDFEGSENANVARFYRGFGAAEKPYFFIQKSTVPGFLKPLFKLKKI